MFSKDSKPKPLHSLEQLRHLYNLLNKNQNVNDHSSGMLVESLRQISEILIWGDQNDSSVFDFFLEKNMLLFFLKFIKQKSGQSISVQLLQTLNILFENISNETSIYYLLSNNHVNSIIIHKFDFSDEEVMAYYISFLKTLSLKLNQHTIHFFFNESTNDFALCSEAIKFFNHPESMVRIAVRTITLNIFRTCSSASSKIPNGSNEGRGMLRFIKEEIAPKYFSSVVGNMVNHSTQINQLFHCATETKYRDKICDLLIEHSDHCHYINDVLALNIPELNLLLGTLFYQNLILPLYLPPIKHLVLQKKKLYPSESAECFVSFYLLSQILLTVEHISFSQRFLSLLLSDLSSLSENSKLEILSPSELKTKFLKLSEFYSETCKESIGEEPTEKESKEKELSNKSSSTFQNKFLLMHLFPLLEPRADDHLSLIVLCFLYSLQQFLETSQDFEDEMREVLLNFHLQLINHVFKILSLSSLTDSKVRIVTLELSTSLVKRLSTKYQQRLGKGNLFSRLRPIYEKVCCLFRHYFKVWEKSEEIFLDMFEDEFREFNNRPLNNPSSVMEVGVLLPPVSTPLSGVDFEKRYPCGEVEKARKAIRVFFIMRNFVFFLKQKKDSNLPLTKPEDCVRIGAVLDLNNSDLIACTIQTSEKKEKRFLVIDTLQLILVEPDSNKIGWGLVKFVGFLQDTEVTSDKDDSRSLQVTINRPFSSSKGKTKPLLSSKFVFDDHIRCMAARQRLTKGRLKARQKKMQFISKLFDFDEISTARSSSSSHTPDLTRRRDKTFLVNQTKHNNDCIKNSIFASVDQVPGFIMVADELDTEKRSRRIKNKIADSLSRQNINKNENLNESSEQKKKFLSMAKEVKQRNCSSKTNDLRQTKPNEVDKKQENNC